MTRDTRRAGAGLLALGSLIAMLTLLAGPAGADAHTGATTQTSGGALATDGSVASGSAVARDNSTASGESTAIDNSTASGCSTAIDDSTASGDDSCARRTTATTRPAVGGGGGTTAARPAATAGRLALTGSWSVPMTAAAALAVVLGALLVVAGSERSRASARA